MARQILAAAHLERCLVEWKTTSGRLGQLRCHYLRELVGQVRLG